MPDIYPMFIEPTITWVPSGFSGYIWLDTKVVFKKIRRSNQTSSILPYHCTIILVVQPLYYHRPLISSMGHYYYSVSIVYTSSLLALQFARFNILISWAGSPKFHSASLIQGYTLLELPDITSNSVTVA